MSEVGPELSLERKIAERIVGDPYYDMNADPELEGIKPDLSQLDRQIFAVQGIDIDTVRAEIRQQIANQPPAVPNNIYEFPFA